MICNGVYYLDYKTSLIQDNSFKVVSIKKEELDITLPKTKMNTFSVRNFVRFAQKFAY